MSSELSVLEEFGASLAPAEEQPPAEVRHRVLRGMRQPVRGRRLAGVRLAWRVGAPAVAAAAVVAALVAGQLADIAGGDPAPPGGGPDVQAGPGSVPVPTAPQDAAQVLLLAAQHTAATPALDARADQFLYIDSVEVESADPGKPLRTRTWLSVDGTRDGLVIQDGRRTHLDGCTDGRQAETIDRPGSTPKVACTPEPAYRPGRIPTDPGRLLAYVYAVAAAEPEWVAVGVGKDRLPKGFVRLSDEQRAFDEIAAILYKNHLPAVQEAAFRAAGRIAGVQVRRDVTDAAGRMGVAVTRTEAGTRQELVFDPASYRYLGHNMIAAEFDLAGATVVRSPDSAKGTGRIRLGSGPAPGQVIYQSALLGIGIVDQAGRRP